MTDAPRAELAALQIADAPEAWDALGFTVSEDGVIVLDGVELWLGAGGRGITGWTLRHITLHHDVDGLPTGVLPTMVRTSEWSGARRFVIFARGRRSSTHANACGKCRLGCIVTLQDRRPRRR